VEGIAASPNAPQSRFPTEPNPVPVAGARLPSLPRGRDLEELQENGRITAAAPVSGSRVRDNWHNLGGHLRRAQVAQVGLNKNGRAPRALHCPPSCSLFPLIITPNPPSWRIIAFSAAAAFLRPRLCLSVFGHTVRQARESGHIPGRPRPDRHRTNPSATLTIHLNLGLCPVRVRSVGRVPLVRIASPRSTCHTSAASPFPSPRRGRRYLTCDTSAPLLRRCCRLLALGRHYDASAASAVQWAPADALVAAVVPQ